MSGISAFFVRKHIEHAGLPGGGGALYAQAGLDAGAARDPARMVEPARYYALLETIAGHEGAGPGAHLRVCATMRCDEFGAMGLAMKSAPTLRHAMQRLWRYTRCFNSTSAFEFHDNGAEVEWAHWRDAPPRLGLHLSNEGALATSLTLWREALGRPLVPLRLQLRHADPGSAAALHAHFGAAPEFGAARDSITFSRAQVDQPTAIGDPGIWQFFASHLEAEAGLAPRAPPGLAGQVMREAGALLSGGMPGIGEVAANLGMSPRTLQRRLAAEGATFQALADEARRGLARQLAGDGRYSLMEIAFLTGFSEQSAFSRAFKRWFGMSPRAYREKLQG